MHAGVTCASKECRLHCKNMKSSLNPIQLNKIQQTFSLSQFIFSGSHHREARVETPLEFYLFSIIKMAAVIDAISLTNPVFRSFVFWSTVMILKMLAMSVLTGMKRFKNKVCCLAINLRCDFLSFSY